MAYSVSDPYIRVAQYLWKILQPHIVMGEFQAESFYKHPKIYPSIVNHIFEQQAPRIEVNALKKV